MWVLVGLNAVFRRWVTHSIHFRSSQEQWLKLDQAAAFASVSSSSHCGSIVFLSLLWDWMEPGSFCHVRFRETGLGCNTIKTGGRKMQLESGKKAWRMNGGFEMYCTSHFFLSYWFTSLIKKERWLLSRWIKVDLKLELKIITFTFPLVDWSVVILEFYKKKRR